LLLLTTAALLLFWSLLALTTLLPMLLLLLRHLAAVGAATMPVMPDRFTLQVQPSNPSNVSVELNSELSKAASQRVDHSDVGSKGSGFRV
jgi:hypothetical protein